MSGVALATADFLKSVAAESDEPGGRRRAP